MSVALVTGSDGFVGRHLQAELRSRGWNVIGLGRTERAATHGERYLRVDLTDSGAVAAALDAERPDVVFHLAAPTAAQPFGPPGSLVGETVAASLGLCSAVRTVGLRTRVVSAGSSAQYGDLSREENPVTEAARGNPVSAYGFAKAAAEAVALGLAIDGAFELVPVRAFNHVGPGEPSTTVAGAFAVRVLDVLAGRADTLTVVDLDVVRDFTDVRDIARGYVDLAERGTPGRVYNLCSGRAATVGDVLDGLLAAAGLDRSVVRVADAAAPGPRRGTVAYQVGAPDRVHAEIGWAATVELAQSTKDLLTQGRQESTL